MPVISVARADELLRAGALDGRTVAVAGYYDSFTPSCPAPGAYIGPLEDWCHFAAFTDSRATAKLCQAEGSNGMSCHGATGTSLEPWFMSETIGNTLGWNGAGAAGEPRALVLIGHAGDARQWQCGAETREACAAAFVVDRVAWAESRDVPVTPPETGDLATAQVISPRMTLAEAADTTGAADGLLTGAPFRAGDIASIDPRSNLTGDGVVWVVRTVGPRTTPDPPEVRPATVWLVDDASGSIIGSHPLALDTADQPGRLWPMAAARGVECCLGEVFAYYRVEATDGAALYEGLVSAGASGDQGATTYGGSGYGSTPLVLPAGSYVVTAWLAGDPRTATGPAQDACTTQVVIKPLEDVRFNADFPAGRACTFRPTPSPAPDG
jgi:hypothetical protein